MHSRVSLKQKHYDVAIGYLKDRFGKNEIILRSHVKKLLNLNPMKSARF